MRSSELPRSKLRGIHSGTIIMGAAAPKPLLAHSSRQQADGYLMALLVIPLCSCNFPTPTTTPPESTCELVADSDIPTYTRPSLDANIFSTLQQGDRVLLEGITTDGWLGFDPGVPQAGNIGSFRLRWINGNDDFTLQGECDGLTEYWGPPAGVCFIMQWDEANVYVEPDTSSEVIATLTQGDFAAVLERIADDWARIDLSIGNTGLDGIGWVEGETFQLNGPCDDLDSSLCITDEMFPPSLSAPQDDEILDELQPLFSWTDLNDCQLEGYAIGVSLDPGMEHRLFGETEYPESTWQPSQTLNPASQYWWTVEPVISSTENSDGSINYVLGPSSERQSFFTGPLCDENALVAPHLVRPADSEQVDPRETLETESPTLVWDYPDECLPDMYQIIVTKNPSAALPLTIDHYTESPTTRWQIDRDLEENTEYYWHVRAIRGNSVSLFSEVRSFVTSEIDPDMPGVINGLVWDDMCANPFPRDDYPQDNDPPYGCVRVNGNIIADGNIGINESGISGITVRVSPGECPPEEGAVASSGPTDEDGRYYYFAPQGTYCVYIDPLEEANSGILGSGIFTSPVQYGPAEQTVTIDKAGRIIDSINFGWDYRFDANAERTSISGRIGVDANSNGSLEHDEPGIRDLEVWLSKGQCDPEWSNKNPGVDLTTRADIAGVFGALSAEVDAADWASLDPGWYCVVIDPNDREYDFILDRGYWTFPIQEDELPAQTVYLEQGEEELVEFGWHYPPYFIPDTSAHCRSGYSTVYETLSFVDAGIHYWLIGRNSTNTWWKTESQCWVSDSTGHMIGDPEDLPILNVPAPTATPRNIPQTPTVSPTPEDNVYPIIAELKVINIPVYSGGEAAFVAIATDNVYVNSIVIWVKEPGASKFIAALICPETQTCAGFSDPLPSGTVYYYATAEDLAGNKTTSMTKHFQVYEP
jgi:hypothetical protein